jgi:hypothetical protein
MVTADKTFLKGPSSKICAAIADSAKNLYPAYHRATQMSMFDARRGAAIFSASVFIWKPQTGALTKAKRVVVIGDGAKWIWNLANEFIASSPFLNFTIIKALHVEAKSEKKRFGNAK